MKKILVIAFILLFWLRGYSTDRYWDAISGNDGNSGSIGSPFKTITKLNSLFSSFLPGDRCYFKRGQIFYGNIIVAKSGTSGARITIDAYGTGNKPIITGLSTVGGWVNVGGNVWQSAAISTLPSYLNTMVQSERLVAVGRYPNLSAADLGYLTISSAVGASQVTISSLLNTPNWTNAWMVARVTHYGTAYRQISSHAGTQVNLTTPFYQNLSAGFGAFFINSILTLDSTSEWYYNPVTKKISWYSVSAPVGVEAATVTSTLTSTNFSNITINNIHFRGSNGSNISLTGGTNWIIQNCKIEFSGVSGIETSNSTNLTIQNDSIYHTQNEAIRVSGTGGVGLLIAGNTIYNSGMIIGMAQDAGGTGRMNGIAVQGSGTLANPVLIRNNSVVKTGYGSIRWDGNYNTIYENFSDSSCIIKNDGGAYYTVGLAATAVGNIIRKNIALHGIGAPQGSDDNAPLAYGIYIDNNASNMLIDSNSIALTEIDIFLHGGENNTMTNNTTFATKYAFHAWQYNAFLVRNLVATNNIFAVSSNSSSAIPGFYRSTTTDIGSFFTTLNNNYYLKPLGTASSLVIRQAATNLTLPMWRTNFPAYDAASVVSPVFVTSSAQVQFVYNKTSSATVTPLTGGWKDARNVSYSGSITLQPYTSALLISTGALIVPTITWSNPSAITYGTALSGTQLNASTGIAGTFTYTPASGTVLNAGSQSLSVLFTPTDQATYSNVSKTVTIVVNKAAATMSYSNLSRTYTGLPLAPTITTSPAGLSTVNTLYNGVGATPTNAGSYSITSALTNSNYTASSISGTFTITKAAATITVTTSLNQTADGTPKVINSITSPLGLTTTTTYAGSGTAPSLPGTYQVIKTINETNYQGADTSTLVITANSAAINITNLQQTYDGFNKPVTVVTIPALQGYSITYNGSPTVAIAAGTYTVIATRNDLSGADTATLIVSKADPVITWAQPAAIPLGTALSSLQLSATADAAGSFAYTPDFGFVPSAGTMLLTTVFTPTATNNYNTVSKSVTISVYGNSNASQTYYIREGHIIYINSP